jgi:hypothetical protein
MPAQQQEIADLMQDYARQAVERARRQEITLDYSEASLEQMEKMLEGFANLANSQIDELARLYGGYFGEVVRRRFGGQWAVEKYPAGDFPIVTLVINGARLFPSMKVHRRLSGGQGENLWTFYQQIRAKLLAQPGSGIQ